MPSEGESLRYTQQIAQHRIHLIAGQYRHHLGQDGQDVAGQFLRVLVDLLVGLLLGVFGLVSHSHRVRRGQPGGNIDASPIEWLRERR